MEKIYNFVELVGFYAYIIQSVFAILNYVTMKKLFLIVVIWVAGVYFCGCNQQNADNVNVYVKDMRHFGLDSLLNNKSYEQYRKREEQLEHERLRVKEEAERHCRREAKRYRRGAWRGDVDSQLALATSYVCGQGVNQNLSKAVKWYKKAARKGLAEAQYRLGGCYMYGIGIRKDEYKAVMWLKRAAEQSFIDAQRDLSLFYYRSGNEVEADKWYIKVLEQDPEDTRSDIVYPIDYKEAAEKLAERNREKQEIISFVKLFTRKASLARKIWK